jgi:hypothetical protein
MKKFSLVLSCMALLSNQSFSTANVELHVQQEGGELQLINDHTKAGITERGGYPWTIVYRAEPGPYTMTGKTPNCPTLTQAASFEEGRPYVVTLTTDCQIQKINL